MYNLRDMRTKKKLHRVKRCEVSDSRVLCVQVLAFQVRKDWFKENGEDRRTGAT